MALEPACRRGRSTGLARGAPTNRRPRATVSCATAPPQGTSGLSLRALCRSRSRWRRPRGSGWSVPQKQGELCQVPPHDPGMQPGQHR